MNKFIIISLIVGVFLVCIAVHRLNKVRHIAAEEVYLHKKIKDIDLKILKLNKFSTQNLPDLTLSLWNLNAQLKVYMDQFHKTVEIRKEVAGENDSLPINESYYPITIRFNDLTSMDDNMRVINLFNKLRSEFPLKINSIEGFDNYLMVNAVLVADQGGVR